jgi:hypothetical protein
MEQDTPRECLEFVMRFSVAMNDDLEIDEIQIGDIAITLKDFKEFLAEAHTLVPIPDMQRFVESIYTVLDSQAKPKKLVDLPAVFDAAEQHYNQRH